MGQDRTAREKFNMLVQELVDEKMSRAAAVQRVIADYPTIRRAMLDEANPGRTEEVLAVMRR